MEQQHQQPETSQEMVALNILAKAAERYLATLDEVARVPTQNHLQSAISVLVNALNPQPIPEVVSEELTENKKAK